MVNKPLKKKSNKFKKLIEGRANSDMNLLAKMTAPELEAEVKRITERNERIPDEFLKNKVEVIDMFLKKIQTTAPSVKTEKRGKKEETTTSPEVSEEVLVFNWWFWNFFYFCDFHIYQINRNFLCLFPRAANYQSHQQSD